jgi:hypothetical protein
MKLNKDGTLAQIDVKGLKTAADVEDLIEQLALLREHMTPAVPENKDDTKLLHMIDNPSFSAARLKDGGFRLYARSSALGWIALNINKDNAPMLTSWMLANMDWLSGLIKQSDGEGDASVH